MGVAGTGCAGGCNFVPINSSLVLPRTSAGLKPGPAPVAGVRIKSMATPALSTVNATAGGTLVAATPGSLKPAVAVEPGHNYVLSGWIRTNGVGWVALQPTLARRDLSSCSVPDALDVLNLPPELIGFHSLLPHWDPPPPNHPAGRCH